ncbi:hypothetical protein OOT46_00940 [Aquabacterium sp. A7-Y]|uniref:HEAT repeat domain-containing protein n=1 Tax=Aquabacterium sp. A7-Y TaxID=1349605 RepID=UPI00223E7D1C|nr:HEAT repeat domain-containing protein [Aquabacterium sp. A7-Y]MCW7536420.1 hypothetical protein [Aquabacterium sp. A7-Y]
MGILSQRTSSGRLSTLTLTAVISGLTGAGLGWSIAETPATAEAGQDGSPMHAATGSPLTSPTALAQGRPQGPATPSVSGPTAGGAGRLSDAEQRWQSLQAMTPDELIRRVQGDKKLAAEMADQIMRGKDADPELLQFLATTLSQAQPKLLERSAEVLLRNPDVQARQKAFDLLSSLPDPPAALATAARQVVLTEGNPQVLAGAISALRDSGSLADMHIDEALVQQLRQHVSSPDPQLRRESVATLIQADRTNSVEPLVRQAVADTDPTVQIIGIGAVVDAGIRSSEAKSQLLEISFNPQADPEVRSEAMDALQSFRLTKEETARLAALQQQQ